MEIVFLFKNHELSVACIVVLEMEIGCGCQNLQDRVLAIYSSERRRRRTLYTYLFLVSGDLKVVLSGKYWLK